MSVHEQGTPMDPVEYLVMGVDPNQARIINETGTLRRSGSAAVHLANVNGATMDPRVGEYVPEEPTELPRHVVDL